DRYRVAIEPGDRLNIEVANTQLDHQQARSLCIAVHLDQATHDIRVCVATPAWNARDSELKTPRPTLLGNLVKSGLHPLVFSERFAITADEFFVVKSQGDLVTIVHLAISGDDSPEANLGVQELTIVQPLDFTYS